MRDSEERKRANAKTLRTRHVFEHEQLHKRLSWLASFEAFLFAATAISWDKSSEFVGILAALGFAMSLQGFFAVYGVGLSLILIKKDWDNLELNNVEPLGLFGLYRGLDRVPDILVFPWPELFIPYVLSLSWFAVLCLHFKLSLYTALTYAGVVSILAFALFIFQIWRRGTNLRRSR